MAADVTHTASSDTPTEDVQVSPCCQVWKNKYSKAEKGRNCLKQAVRLLEKGCDDIQAQNLTLKKAYEEEQARLKVEKESREKESSLIISLENELSALKSEISNLKKNRVSDAEDKAEEIKLLKASVFDREKEINWLKELVQKEKTRADLEAKNAAAEKKKAAEASKHAEIEKGKACEEQKRADVERKKAEDYRIQLEALRKEVDKTKSNLASDKSKFDKATKHLQEEKRKAVEERKHVDLEIAKVKEQRKIAEEAMKQAVEERKHADLEIAKAEEQRKIAEKAMKLAAEERKHADIEIAKAQEQRKIAEEAMKQAVEERRCVDLEIAKAKEQQKLAKKTKNKVFEERKLANLGMAKVEEQRKIAKGTKKAVEEKLYADDLFKQLEEVRKRNEELEKKLYGSRNFGEGPFDQSDINSTAETEKTKRTARMGVLKGCVDKSKAVSNLLAHMEVEKKKGICERKQADLEMKAVKKRKLVEVNTNNGMEEKLHADHLLKQLEDARLKIDELQKQIHELSSSRKTVDPLLIATDKCGEVAKLKLLRKELKLEKKRVKHAEDVAKFEKRHSYLLQQEVGRVKLELVQFMNRLDAINKCFSTPSEGIDDMEKAGDFASMQRLNLKEKKCNLNFQTCPQVKNQLLKARCKDKNVSSSLWETLQHDEHVLPVQGGNSTELATGSNSKLESLLRVSNKKMLPSSAMNSPTSSFSDGQLVGSQERCALSVTTLSKLQYENLNAEQTLSGISGEVTRNRCTENLAVVAENSVKSPLRADPLERVNGCGSKRKRIVDAIESVELLCLESKKLHLLLDDKLSVLYGMVKGQTDQPREKLEMMRSDLELQDISFAVHDRLHKRRKISHEETEAMRHSCDGLQMTHIQNSHEPKEDATAFTPASQAANYVRDSAKFSAGTARDSDTVDPKIMAEIEVVTGNYMKLLDLDNAAEEECYRMAAEMPLSPTLPTIEFPGIKTFEMDQSRPMQDDNCELFIHEDDTVASSGSFDVINVEKGYIKLQSSTVDASPKLLQQEDECSPTINENSYCNDMPVGSACLGCPQNSGDDVVNFPFEIEIGSTDESIPKYCIVLSDVKDSSCISRIFGATKSCMARCSLPAQTEFIVHRILHAIKLEEKLLAKEKVCVFFSLVLHNFCTTTSGNCSLIKDFIPSLNLFVKHINTVMSAPEPRSIVSEFFLDELLSVIEDFLIEGRVLLYTNLSSETSVQHDSRIHFTVDGLDVILSHEAGPADLLLAGSIILGSICVATSRIGFMCEAAYNIFRMHRCDTSVVLVILHVFAYVGGDKFFTLTKYGLTINVLKSIVTFRESERPVVATAILSSWVDVQAQFHACVGCPFSKDVLSVDIIVSSLFDRLQYYAQSGTILQKLASDSSNTSVMSVQDKSEQNLSCALDMNCDVSCCLCKHNLPRKALGSVGTETLCDVSDILSLIELLACNMSWEWVCKNINSRVLSMLESSVPESLTLAIIILIGQLGRLGVDAAGYEDAEVEKLRVKLSAFLLRETTIRSGLPIQLATINALLGLISLNFENLNQENVKLPVMSDQFVSAGLIRNWLALLTEEQRAMAIRLFKAVD